MENKTATIKVDEFEFLVWFNSSDSEDFGITPFNQWFVTLNKNKRGYQWQIAFDENIKTIEDAVEAAKPIIKKAVERIKRKDIEPDEDD